MLNLDNRTLLIQLLWAYHSTIIHNLPLDNKGYVTLLSEVDDRIFEKTDKNFVIDSLLEIQREVSLSKNPVEKLKFISSRSKELRKIESILGIEKPIQKKSLP